MATEPPQMVHRPQCILYIRGQIKQWLTEQMAFQTECSALKERQETFTIWTQLIMGWLATWNCWLWSNKIID